MFSDALSKEKIKRKDAEIASLKEKNKEMNSVLIEALDKIVRLENQIETINNAFVCNSKDMQESIEELNDLKQTYREKIRELTLLKKKYTKEMQSFLNKNK